MLSKAQIQQFIDILGAETQVGANSKERVSAILSAILEFAADSNYIEKTKVEVDGLIANGLLVPGATYRITGVDVNSYPEEGVTVIAKATDRYTFSQYVEIEKLGSFEAYDVDPDVETNVFHIDFGNVLKAVYCTAPIQNGINYFYPNYPIQSLRFALEDLIDENSNVFGKVETSTFTHSIKTIGTWNQFLNSWSAIETRRALDIDLIDSDRKSLVTQEYVLHAIERAQTEKVMRGKIMQDGYIIMHRNDFDPNNEYTYMFREGIDDGDHFLFNETTGFDFEVAEASMFMSEPKLNDFKFDWEYPADKILLRSRNNGVAQYGLFRGDDFMIIGKEVVGR